MSDNIVELEERLLAVSQKINSLEKERSDLYNSVQGDQYFPEVNTDKLNREIEEYNRQKNIIEEKINKAKDSGEFIDFVGGKIPKDEKSFAKKKDSKLYDNNHSFVGFNNPVYSYGNKNKDKKDDYTPDHSIGW